MSNAADRTILCIDDDQGALDYHRALLERSGYLVLTASSARRGVEVARTCAITLVIVDYHMPEMDGHEVATRIKRLRPHTPIVMVSSDVEIPEHVLSVVDAFVPKDETSSRLLPVLSKICGESGSALSESA